jgi:hypothetical protein
MEYLRITRDDVWTQFSWGRQSVCQQRGTHHALGSPPDTVEQCSLPEWQERETTGTGSKPALRHSVAPPPAPASSADSVDP